MAFDPTREQSLAITTNGNVLVSAAAGSGKTAVLVERVISRLCDSENGISADRLLIVTFTNAAAAEMRSRIEKRLDEVIEDNPDNISLLLQKHLLASAKICTIDSFCIDLVRENFEKVGVSPDFKISDGVALAVIDRRVLNSIINRYLEENNATFLELLDIVGAEFDEQNFADFVLEIYNYSRQLPFPKKWFYSLSEPYGKEFDSDNLWWKYAISVAVECINNAQNAIKRAKELLGVSEKAQNGYMTAFCELEDRLTVLQKKAILGDWDALFEELENFSSPSLPVVRGVGDISEIITAKDIFKTVTTKTLSRVNKLFFASTEFINAQFKKLYSPLKLLGDILCEFEESLFEEYTKANTYTFHNTEHLALNLLCEDVGDEIKIRPEAEELLSRFDEVMVDEYQDTNDLQDKLFYVLSDRESKLFVVGDVKQSIYGFRGANPSNFLNKKKRYVPIDNASGDEPKKIILGNNFRCKNEVCDFVNYFFKMFMNDSTGELIYNEEEMLIPAAKYPETDSVATEFQIITTKGSEYSSSVLEGRKIAEYIKNTMSSGCVIKQDDDNLRPAKYSDFTILLRSAKLKAPIIANELKRQGIPVSYSSEEFLETTEISTFISLLKVIDNPKSDIDLLTVLMSPIFAFTPDKMANLRIADRKSDIYGTIITAAQNGDQLANDFLKQIDNYRILAITNPLPKLISILLLETGYLDTVTAFEDGAKRRNNLLLLNSYAEQFSTDGNLTLSQFLKRIEKLSSGLKAAAASSGGDSVKIMSIHASKGLQFPVCIVAGMGSSFNDSEAHESAIYSTEYGLGFKYFDEDEKTKITTLSREAMLDRARATRLEEELRLLYVAMTRTQDKLLFVGSVSDIDKKTDELKSLLISSDYTINSFVFSRTKSYLDWLILSMLMHPDGKDLRGVGHNIIVKEDKSRVNLKICDHSQINDLSVAMDVFTESEPDTDLAKAIAENLSYTYPFEEILTVESKASVSKLVGSAENIKYAFSDRPEFMNKGGLSASQKGTAMHKVMQFFDFSKFNDIEQELTRLYEWQFITDAELDVIDRDALKIFFESSVFERIKNAITVKREMRFLTEMSAANIAPYLSENLKKEKIIVQGAVDVCFEEDDGIVILDFKTDRVDNAESLVNTYGEQLNIYAAACEKIYGKRVKEKIIYSFFKNKEIAL